MSGYLEVLLLYYVCWHERELSLTEMRGELINEIGEAGLKAALGEFIEMRLQREVAGDHRTYYQIQKGQS